MIVHCTSPCTWSPSFMDSPRSFFFGTARHFSTALLQLYHRNEFLMHDPHRSRQIVSFPFFIIAYSVMCSALARDSMTSEGWATTDTGDGWKVWTATSSPHWAWDRQPFCSSPRPTASLLSEPNRKSQACKAQQAGTVLKHPAWRPMRAQSMSTGQVKTRAGSPSCDADRDRVRRL